MQAKAAKHKTTIYPGGLNQKRNVNNFAQAKGGLTGIDLYDTICMIRLI